eukprot:368188_1
MTHPCATYSPIPLSITIMVLICYFIALIYTSIVSVKALKMSSPANTPKHRQLSTSRATPTAAIESNKLYKTSPKVSDEEAFHLSPKRILSYVSNATSNNFELEEIMEEVLLLSDYEDQKSTEDTNITNNKYKIIETNEEPEEHKHEIDNISSTKSKSKYSHSKIYKSQWSNASGFYAKFMLYLADIWLRKTIYFWMLCHLIDIATDFGVLIEFGIVANTHSSQQCGIDVWYLFCISIICMLTYRCISAYQIWKITGSVNRLLIQLIDMEIHNVLYFTHVFGFEQISLPFRLICALETIFEAAPLLLIQLIYLMLIKNDSVIVILSAIFSCINVLIAIIGDNKHTCKETTNINELIMKNKYQDAIELIVFSNSNIDYIASQLYGDINRRYSLLAMGVASIDNNRIFEVILQQKGLDDFGDDEYVTGLFMACYKHKIYCIQSIICSTDMNIRYINKTIYGKQTTALGYLIMYGTLEMMQGFLKGINKWLRCYRNKDAIKVAILNKTGGDTGNALHLACYRQEKSLKVFK